MGTGAKDCSNCPHRRLSRQHAALAAQYNRLHAAVIRMRRLRRELFLYKDRRIMPQLREAEKAVDELLEEASQPALF